MKKPWILGLAGSVLLAIAPLPTLAQVAGDEVPGQYIVELKAKNIQARSVASLHGLALKAEFAGELNGFAAFIPPGKLKDVENDPSVASVTPDRYVSIAGFKTSVGAEAFAVQFIGSSLTGDAIPAGVHRIGADTVTYTGTGVGVAIVDTGIDVDHPEFAGKVIAGYSYPAYGSSYDDNNGHGTHVAGIVAAPANSIGVVGVAPAASLYAVKVLDAAGNGTDASIIAGLNWVANNYLAVTPPIRVVNMSLGRPGKLTDSPALRTAVQNLYKKNIAVVVAAGNDPTKQVTQMVPAGYPEVMAVASTSSGNGTSLLPPYQILADTASFFTTDGSFNTRTKIGVTTSSPGETQEDIDSQGYIASLGIYSTYPVELGEYASASGTSMAAPHVAGVLALMWQKAGALTLKPEDARAKIRSTATRVGVAPLNSPTSTYSYDREREGVIWAPAALQ